MKRWIIVAVIAVVIGGLALTVQAQGPITHTIKVGFDWVDHVVYTSTNPFTITHNVVMAEMRKDGTPQAVSTASAPDCSAIYSESEVPTGGPCGSVMTITVMLPYYPGRWEEWARAAFVDEDELEYTVPFSPSFSTDERGYHLVGYLQVGEWYETCPTDPATPTPAPLQPTYTPRPTYTPLPTYTPQPTPTCRATATSVPPPTPYPTDTPYPTQIPYPTDTPYPPQP